MVALQKACSIAKRQKAELVVVGVVDKFSSEDPRLHCHIKQLQETEIRESENRLDELIERSLRYKTPRRPITRVVTAGRSVEEIIRLVEEGEFDLVIKSECSRSLLKKLLLGNVDRRLTNAVPCPVWILESSSYPVTRLNRRCTDSRKNLLSQSETSQSLSSTSRYGLAA